MASKEPPEDGLMDNSIVHDFKNLRVLTPYDFHQMDELVQDLTHALEETTRHRKSKHGSDNHHRRVKKKSKKRKSSNPNNKNLGNGNISEASESSIDEAIKGYMENMIQLSDSDDLILNGSKVLPSLDSILKFSSQSISVAESDSFTENSPMRPGRRRRRFKRMAVDAQPDSEISIIEYLNEQRLKRLRTLKPKLKVQEHKNDKDMDSEASLVQSANSDSQATPTKQEIVSLNVSGKRKRCVRNGSSFDGVIEEEVCSEVSAANGTSTEIVLESSSSIGSNSNSSSDGDSIYTDGGREGDDEQSDFYHEPGAACGIPGIIPWWETDKFVKEEEENLVTEAKFNMILNGSFQHMSKEAQRSFMSRLKLMTRPGREIRIGRRRLKDRKPGYSVSHFLHERHQWSESANQIWQKGDSSQKQQKPCDNLQESCEMNVGIDALSSNGGGSNGSQHGETKRRRKTPPNTPEGSMSGELVGAEAEPIPESNIGNRLLQSMGWFPGSGLGPTGNGITTPITALKRSGRKGLGNYSCNISNISGGSNSISNNPAISSSLSTAATSTFVSSRTRRGTSDP